MEKGKVVNGKHPSQTRHREHMLARVDDLNPSLRKLATKTPADPSRLRYLAATRYHDHICHAAWEPKSWIF
jgi:hypothetical protein